MRTADQGMADEVRKGQEQSLLQHKEGNLKLHLKLALNHAER